MRPIASTVRLLLLPLLFVALVSLGCSKGHSKNPRVNGKVTQNGTPLGGGNVTFHPTAGGADIPVSLSPEGTFSATLPAGEYQVAVETESIKKMSQGYVMPKDQKMPAGVSAPPKSPMQYVKINPAYANPKTSGLKAEVTADTKELSFDLNPAGPNRK